MKANAEPRLLSSLVWIDSSIVVSQHRLESFFHETKCYGKRSFMEFMPDYSVVKSFDLEHEISATRELTPCWRISKMAARSLNMSLCFLVLSGYWTPLLSKQRHLAGSLLNRHLFIHSMAIQWHCWQKFIAVYILFCWEKYSFMWNI